MLSILLTIVIGGVIGWLASKLMNRDGDQGVILNVVVGIVGAFLANLLLAPLFGGEARLDTLNVWSLLLAFGGAVALLAIVNLFTRGRLR